MTVLCILAAVSHAQNEVPVEAEFAGKVVYTTDAAFDQEILSEDCDRRGGWFNECGSVCDDTKDTTCVTVCAFTCEFEQKRSDDREI
jgi:hypothetical protein